MTTSHNKSSKSTSGLLAHAFQAAKKMGDTGLDVLNQVAPKTAAKLGVHPQPSISIRAAQQQFSVPQYEHPQHMLRQHLPKMSHQLLGKHYHRVNSLAAMISPELNDKIADYFFHHLNQLALNLSTVDSVLEQSGAKHLADLAHDTQQSQRFSQQLIEQNKLMALAQGAVTGLTGVLGAAVDVPAAMALALKTIYQTGRAHGFELSRHDEQEVVQYIFKDIDLSLLAEKQTLLVALKGLKSVLYHNDVAHLQQLLGSGNNLELLKSWLTDEQGQLKWEWLQNIPTPGIFAKLTPVASAGLSALYSWKLVEDAGRKAQAVFGGARHYLLEHPTAHLSPLQAYLKTMNELPSADTITEGYDDSSVSANPSHASHNPNISKVHVVAKQTAHNASEQQVDLAVEQGIQQLAASYVSPHDAVTAQQPALTATDEPNLLNILSHVDADDAATTSTGVQVANEINEPHIHHADTPKRS